MNYRSKVFILVFVSIGGNSYAEGTSYADEYLELLEVEVVESLCNDHAFRSQINATWKQCANMALTELSLCSKALHMYAPRDDAIGDASRFDKDAFLEMYSNCLIREMTK